MRQFRSKKNFGLALISKGSFVKKGQMEVNGVQKSKAMLFFLKKVFGKTFGFDCCAICKIENEGKIVLLFLVVYLTLRCVAKSL